MGTDLDSVPENTGKVKKTKSKKTKYSDDALVEPTKVDPKGGDDAELKKEKKRKRKAEKVEEDDEKPKKSKKRKKEQNPLTVVEDGPAPTSPIDADSANPADRDSHESKEKKREKKKKDKKHKKDPEGRTDEPSKDEVRIKKDKKKKRRGDTLANPEEDDTLEDQARKALVYVYTQIENPSRWKFNKAKQNWLIRNIWSSQAVPDKYFPQVIHYLGDMKGAARENLIQSCKAQLEPPNESTGVAVDENAKEASSAHIDEVKQDRANRLLAALGQVS